MGIVTLDMKASCFQLAGRLAQNMLDGVTGKNPSQRAARLPLCFQCLHGADEGIK